MQRLAVQVCTAAAQREAQRQAQGSYNQQQQCKPAGEFLQPLQNVKHSAWRTWLREKLQLQADRFVDSPAASTAATSEDTADN